MPARLPLALAACALVVLSSCGGGGGASGDGPRGDRSDATDRPTGCPEVGIVGLRGQAQSLQKHDGLGAEVDGIVRRMTAALARDGVRDVQVDAIRHRSRNTATLSVFEQDVAQGRTLLARRLEQVERRCPTTRLAVVGFSQGAQIAHETLAARPDLARRVAVLVLVGSPRHDPAADVRKVDLPGATPTGHGSLGAGPSLGGLTGRTVDACITGDVVCSVPSGGARDYTTHKQAYERPAVSRLVARAAVAVLQR
ncbi:MAG: cutinase family protein [Aeromicrobium erythreum]